MAYMTRNEFDSRHAAVKWNTLSKAALLDQDAKEMMLLLVNAPDDMVENDKEVERQRVETLRRMNEHGRAKLQFFTRNN